MEKALAIQEEFDDQVETRDAGEVIDAFDHVIEALDQVYKALAQFADPKGTEPSRR